MLVLLHIQWVPIFNNLIRAERHIDSQAIAASARVVTNHRLDTLVVLLVVHSDNDCNACSAVLVEIQWRTRLPVPLRNQCGITADGRAKFTQGQSHQ